MTRYRHSRYAGKMSQGELIDSSSGIILTLNERQSNDICGNVLQSILMKYCQSLPSHTSESWVQ